jgi:hypothetical protein
MFARDRARPMWGCLLTTPGIEMRVWLWQTWKYSVQGILIWETTWWHNPFAYPDRLQNPWDDPMSYVWDASFKPGTRQFWGNGDGRLLYPLRRDPNASDEPIIADPIPSIRWECLRDGAEDYEYFVLLERLVRQAEGRRVDARLLATGARAAASAACSGCEHDRVHARPACDE